MAWGFIMAPLQYRWFQFLSRTFPITKTSATTQALKRVVCDQVFFAPLGEKLSDFGTGGPSWLIHGSFSIRSRAIFLLHDPCRRAETEGH